MQQLIQAGHPDRQLSLFGKADLIDGHVQVPSGQPEGHSYLNAGIAAAAVIEVVALVGIVAVPGFGLLFGAGAAVGGFAALTTALVAGGGISAVFTGEDLSADDEEKYEKYLIAGKFLVFVHGDDKHRKQAHELLQSQGLAIELT
jgi:hypothetical protein